MTAGAPAASESIPVRPLSDALYRQITILLRVGLAVAVALFVGGALGYLTEHPNESFSAMLTPNPIGPFLVPSGLLAGLARLDPVAFLTVGVYILVIVPVARVALAAYHFELGKERDLAWVTTAVFVMLILGLFVVGPLLP